MAIPTAEYLSNLMRDKRVTYRRHGVNGELRKPMMHRFPVKGGVSVLDAMADQIYQTSPILKLLMKESAA